MNIKPGDTVKISGLRNMQKYGISESIARFLQGKTFPVRDISPQNYVRVDSPLVIDYSNLREWFIPPGSYKLVQQFACDNSHMGCEAQASQTT